MKEKTKKEIRGLVEKYTKETNEEGNLDLAEVIIETIELVFECVSDVVKQIKKELENDKT